MSDVRIALVAEGPTDKVVIEAALKALLQRPFVLTLLHPEATRPDLGAGWGGVFKWCYEFRQRGAAGFEADPILGGFDLVIVHLDADGASCLRIAAPALCAKMPTAIGRREGTGSRFARLAGNQRSRLEKLVLYSIHGHGGLAMRCHLAYTPFAVQRVGMQSPVGRTACPVAQSAKDAQVRARIPKRGSKGKRTLGAGEIFVHASSGIRAKDKNLGADLGHVSLPGGTARKHSGAESPQVIASAVTAPSLVARTIRRFGRFMGSAGGS